MEARFTDEYGEDLYVLDSESSVQTSVFGRGTRHTPAQAREIAAAFLRAADEADWAAGVNTYPDVPAEELRVGDVLRPSVDYRGDDNDQTATCTAVMKRTDAPYLRVTWRMLESGETWTSTMHERESVCLMRRGPVNGR
ncbi:hypothetical protein [Streptomyces sp. NBC_00076]|uniref:hypothetical protein n=1 Tax=Streptomyces sp. NBC_00076 TaxID=2975642 RepID=UPI00324713C1